MILYFLKVAWRNLLKYKAQSVISILGLAIGFMAFSFTMSWISFEYSYDSFTPDADRIYQVVKVDPKLTGGIKKVTPEPLALYLESTFPEVEAATSIDISTSVNDNLAFFYFNNQKDSIADCYQIITDTSFFNVFYAENKPRINHPIPSDVFYATESMMQRLNKEGRDSVLFFSGSIPDRSYHSNVPFDLIQISPRRPRKDDDCDWCSYHTITFLKVREGADVNALAKKMSHIEVENSFQGVMSFKLIPLRKAHYQIPNEKTVIQFNHLKIFAAVSLMVIFCGLFNYLMLFVNRIKMRGKELALRKVNASSDKQLLMMLMTEFFLVLFISLFIGGLLTECLYPSFLKLSMIEAPRSYFMLEALLYGCSIAFISIVTAFFPIRLLMKRSIRENIQPETKVFGGIQNRFTVVSLLIQLIFGVLLLFCSLVFYLQLRNLNRSDIGFDRFNINTIQSWYGGVPIDEIRKIKGVEEVIPFDRLFLPRGGRASSNITEAGDKKFAEAVEVEIVNVNGPDFTQFFSIPILSGRNLRQGVDEECLINETAKRVLGFDDPIGKKLQDWVIVGVIPDLYIDSPLLPVLPCVYRSLQTKVPDNGGVSGSYAYRYSPDNRIETEQAILAVFAKSGVTKGVTILNMDDVYTDYTKSERYLLVLLGLMTLVALLIVTFGVYSMITFSCNQRRKEIAIRKVNGARISEIFRLFIKQYVFVTVLACIIAFPMGVYVMQRWLEQYVCRIHLEWWIFVSVFGLILLIVVAGIFSKLYKAASENPAETVKSV